MDFELWENKNGVCYAGGFIKDQPDAIAIKIATLLEDLQKFSFLVLSRKDKIKKIGKELYEIRLRIKSNNYRFLFVMRKNKAWILEGFLKKTDKTPKKHIENAENRIASLDKEI
jgi:phage-related protein